MPEQSTSIHAQEMARKGGHACTVLRMRRLRVYINAIFGSGRGWGSTFWTYAAQPVVGQ